MSAGGHSPVSPKSFSYNQKHIRSSSLDSYFERILEYPADDELEQEESMYEDLSAKLTQTVSDKSDFESKMDTTVDGKIPCEQLTPTRKTGQKQKLVSFESEASSPKLQKISLKRLYHTLSSPPMMKKKDSYKRTDTSSAEKQSLVQNDSLQSDDGLRKCQIIPRNKLDGSVKTSKTEESPETSLQYHKIVKSSVPSLESTTHVSHERSLDDLSSVKDTVSVEVHKTISNSSAFPEDSSYRSRKDSMCLTDEGSGDILRDDSTDLMSFSMEATISDSVNLSQLLSYDSRDGDRILSENKERHSEYGAYPVDSSLTTPESPTGENVSELLSSGDSEVSGSISDLHKQMVISDSFIMEVQNKHFGNTSNIEKDSYCSNETDLLTNGTLPLKVQNTEVNNALTCEQEQSQTRAKENVDDKMSLLSPPTCSDTEAVDNHSFEENIILSPPANFVDHRVSPTATVQKQEDSIANKIRSEIKSSAKSPGAKSIERSMTEIHEICPKFVSGIAVSGSFGHELCRANNDFVESFHKKRSCSDKVSPISPIEESRRRFESEIGRLIVRDRQMKLEMEQIKAERQKYKQEKSSSTPSADKSKVRGEKKFADVLDFRKSPIKAQESDKKRLDSDELLKNFKESMEEKKQPDSVSSHAYSCYLRLESKPSVKELLSKFEGHKKEEDSSESPSKCSVENTVSSPKHTSSVFSNVQVINHNFPQTPSKTLNSSDVNQSPKDNQSSHVREHIFQTECVVRFPHPKSSSFLKQNCTDSYKNGSLSDYSFSDSGSNSWTSGQSDHHTKVCSSKTAFFSSDNLAHSSGQDLSTSFSHSKKSPYKSSVQTEQAQLSKSQQSTWDSDNVQHSSDVQNSTTQSECPGRPFTGFKDTFDRAKKSTYQMKTEFFQRGLSQDKLQFDTSPGAVSNSTFCDENHSSRSVAENRKRHAPARQRPKSVPPPISRLSYVPENQTYTDKTSFLRSHVRTIPKENIASQNVPKTCNVNLNGKESSNTSQNHEPPPCIKDRAAIFERSLSFSGSVDKKTFSSSSQSQKAQSDSSDR